MLGGGAQKQRWAAGGEVEIRGELSLAQELQAIFATVEIDWEEMLARMTGDVVAHELGNAARAFRRWVSDARKSVELDIAEYIKYEKRLVPAARELMEFDDDLACLRDDVERLEQRILRLSRLAQSS